MFKQEVEVHPGMALVQRVVDEIRADKCYRVPSHDLTLNRVLALTRHLTSQPEVIALQAWQIREKPPATKPKFDDGGLLHPTSQPVSAKRSESSSEAPEGSAGGAP